MRWRVCWTVVSLIVVETIVIATALSPVVAAWFLLHAEFSARQGRGVHAFAMATIAPSTRRRAMPPVRVLHAADTCIGGSSIVVKRAESWDRHS